jgi:broad specificity phosphatase PhoE
MARTSDDQARPAERTIVYLARHGQTALNSSGVLRGLADPPLDETGQEQARQLAASLGSRDLSLVAASPLRRAVETARPVADRAGLVVISDECLTDRDYGPCTGVSEETVIARWGSVDNAPGVEAKSAVRDRAMAGLSDLARRFEGRTVVAVSHDAVNRQVLAALDPGLGDPDAIAQDNGCFNTLELRDGTWAVLAVNQVPPDLPHLPPG